MNNILALLIWVSAVSGYPMPADHHLPRIQYKYLKMTNTPCGDNFIPTGVTYPPNGRIEIDIPHWKKLGEPDNTCILAHELTHFLQIVNHKDQDAPEPAAYAVQAKCLYKHGLDGSWAEEISKQKDPYNLKTCK